ncbi:2-oxo-4-hydroxy-4-carboxy-5-ureidoimidazoline decarboxylase [Orrella daihaiensis]|uniref:2-oxo-4-hydroxy-4-carboxy-5-ureidoimidazoline decarboxylase n=1 Tax=Orrella daihaiensis TaxID=2782176 RepID=A0ABY4AHZ9_9BURK|nr:2-oxo-4-hydroxy-4-carboxy-5-ureidoimidazoline decarboxylase [Orrella daihaiensis]UOD49921.1 2-oxo-4-hydroxy-4-carboxy-5-ureidoimidazoline decarboxylase [Orrella daihaiensis]
MTITLDQINGAGEADLVTLLDGIYEHSAWIVRHAAGKRPFASLTALKHGLTEIVNQAAEHAQLELIRAYPEIACEIMHCNSLMAKSAYAQDKLGLIDFTSEELEELERLNLAYKAKFGFPFILAVRGPRGTGLGKAEIISTLARRLNNPVDFERREALRNIHRIAELRLNDKFDAQPVLGNQLWDWCEELAVHSEPGYLERGELTVTYLTEAHQACAQHIARLMRDECGFDDVSIDAVGNVVGVYHGMDKNAKRLLTGSHYDTVRNGGKYDGRLGIFAPMLCVKELADQAKRLSFGIEVVAFSEEEGQRYKAVFLGSGALTGQFNPDWLDQIDANGISMRQAMQNAGLSIDDIASIKRDPNNYLGFVEVHIEQGPVLNELDLPLGVVTSINGGVRLLCEVRGMASHAGTTPMGMRRDAAVAVAELALYLEKRAASVPDLVGTIGMLEVPSGSINVVPGRCRFSLDIRATTDQVRDACVADVKAELASICQRRGVQFELEEIMRVAAAPSAPEWQSRWERAVKEVGLPVFRMPSGAGHDAMKLHDIMPQAMLFVRGLNSGISHNPLEMTTNDDAHLCVQAFMHVLGQIK